MKRKIVLGCGIPLAVVAGLGWLGVRALRGADDKPLRLATVDRGDVEVKVTEVGTIEPYKKVEIKSKVAGRVAKLYVQEGDRVRAGQLLAEIDPTEINSQVEQIRAQRAGAQARYQASTRTADYQADQTRTSVAQYEQGLQAAEAQLRVAEEDARAEPSRSASDVAQAEAALKSAQDSLNLLGSSTHPQAVVQAQSGYAEAQAAEDNARKQLERQQRLFAKGYAAQQVVDAAASDLASARARLDQTKNRLDLIEEQNKLEIASAQHRVAEAQAALDRANAGRASIAIKAQQVRAARAAVAQARAQLAAARAGAKQDMVRRDEVAESQASVRQIDNQLREVEVRQHDTRLLATMSGVVTRRYIEEGELVTSGVSTFSTGTPVLQIADLSSMLVKMSVNEVDVHKVRAGLPVEIRVDGARGTPFLGRVHRVSPASVASGADQGQGSGGSGGTGVVRFAVEVLVRSADPRLKPGMSARCSIIVARRAGVLRLPADCVQGEGAKATAQVPHTETRDGKAVTTYTATPITAGLRGDTHVEVVSGLKQGDKVKPGIYSGPKRQSLDLDMH